MSQDAHTLSLFGQPTAAGFPSPTDEFIEHRLNLNHLLMPHPSATFMLRASGDAMTNAGIFSGDILIVDRSLSPKHGHIIIVCWEGGLIVRRLSLINQHIRLLAENNRYPPLTVCKEGGLQTWGVVTANIHQYVSFG